MWQVLFCLPLSDMMCLAKACHLYSVNKVPQQPWAEADGHRRTRCGQKTYREGGLWGGLEEPPGGSSTRAVSGILCRERGSNRPEQCQCWGCVRILLCPVFAPTGIYPIYKCINGSHLKIHPEIELAMGFFFPLTKMKVL